MVREEQHEKNYDDLTNFQNSYDEDNEDQEDTLSLCDLPIYSDSDKWEQEYFCRSVENDNNSEFFEFFTEDFTKSLNDNNNTDIVFCGKIISYKTQYTILPPTTTTQQSHEDLKQKSKNDSENSLSLVSSAAMKPRWYLFVFGIVRFPSEMGLRDMRTRIRRRSMSFTMFPEFYDGKKEKTTKGNRTAKIKGLLGFFRLLGCRSRLATDVCVQC